MWGRGRYGYQLQDLLTVKLSTYGSESSAFNLWLSDQQKTSN